MTSSLNDSNQVKKEAVPDKQTSSTSMKALACVKPYGGGMVAFGVGSLVDALLPVTVQSAYRVSGATSTQHHSASVPTDSVIKSRELSPERESRTPSDHDEEPGTNKQNDAGPVPMPRKKKIFNASYLCPKRVAKLSASDRNRLSVLIQLKHSDLKEAMLHVNMPPFPTASEMARAKRFRKVSLKADKNGLSLPKASSRKKTRKVSFAVKKEAAP